MCAIAVGKDVGPMLDLMKHRGPDGFGIVKRGDIELGMARLAVIDTHSKGLCPIEVDGRVLVFNGEIYNYIELRAELAGLGVSFRTDSDSEVLLRAYIQWGSSFIDKLNGMFAFAIWDSDTIICARDHAGEKPLYYSTKPFALASEAKALKWECLEFPKGYMGIYRGGKFALHRWFSIKKQPVNPDTAMDELEALLADSVRLRTRSDVPYALYYSGGVDSSLISTFHDFDMLITYKDLDNKKQDFLDNFEKISWHLDYPIKSFSAYGLWNLAQTANHKGIKVVLSGEGADELFGGYVRYLPEAMNREAALKNPSYASLFPYETDVTRRGFEEFDGNMQELLRMGDRMASAWGVENRCPFLDKRIVQFAYNLPIEWKIQGLTQKRILRELLQKRMPGYKDGEKHGLYVQVNNWLGVEDKFDKTAYYGLQQKHHETFRRCARLS